MTLVREAHGLRFLVPSPSYWEAIDLPRPAHVSLMFDGDTWVMYIAHPRRAHRWVPFPSRDAGIRFLAQACAGGLQ